jgi:hypothetical protein
MHGAGAAQPYAAAEFRPGHLQMFANDPQERRVAGHIDDTIETVDGENSHVIPSH